MKEENFTNHQIIFFNFEGEKTLFLSKGYERALVKSIKRKNIFQGKYLDRIKASEEVNHVIELINGNLLLLELKGIVELFSPDYQLLKSITLGEYILCGIEWKENLIICNDRNKIVLLNLNGEDGKIVKEKDFFLKDPVINSIVHLYDDVFACGDQHQNFYIFNLKEKILYENNYQCQVTRLFKMSNDNLLIPTINGKIDIFDWKSMKVIESLYLPGNNENLWCCVELKNGNIVASSKSSIYIWKDGQLSSNSFNEYTFLPLIELQDENNILFVHNNFVLIDQNLEIVKTIPTHIDIREWKLFQIRNGKVLVVNYSEYVMVYE